MSLFFSAVQFVETSVLFSAFLFSAIMYIRTRDGLAGRTLLVLFPVSSLLFISYMYSINGASSANLEWLSPLFALLVIFLIMSSILATCYYVIQLFPTVPGRKKKGFLWAALLVAALLVITCILMMYISKSDLTRAITNALWAFYPLCSLALFFEAVALAVVYRKIESSHDRRLARYFLIAFLPQALFSILDFILLRDISFQLTHISYSLFSLFVFVDLSGYFFRSYGAEAKIAGDINSLKGTYLLSDREMEVAGLLLKGVPNQQIGETLHISVNTVKSHIKKIYVKLGISNRLQLINLIGGNHNHRK